MALELRVNNTLISDDHIRSYPKSIEVLSVDGRLFPEKLSFKIDNIKELYDDRYSGSLFYNTLYYGDPVTVYDTSLNRYIYQGTLTNYKLDESSIEFEASNVLKNLSQTPCVYSNTSDKTPAEIIYELLTDVAEVDVASIVYSGFQEAITIQDYHDCYANVIITAAKSTTVINVINELLKRTQCELWTIQNLIYMKQWQAYAGQAAQVIEKRHIMPSTYKHYYDTVGVYNSYKIAYDNGGTVAYITGSDATSIARYGERTFNIPVDEATTTDSTQFDILFRNVTGATWAGDLAIQRYKNVRKICEMTLTHHLDYVQLGQQVDLNDYPYMREPVRVIQREHILDDQQVKLVCEFLNQPVPYISRDITAPDPVELVAVIPMLGGVLVKWSVATEVDFVGYKVYFTTSPGEWHGEYCNRGISPVDIKSSLLTADGYAYAFLTQLSGGMTYYFRVTAYDHHFNESDPSNVLSCEVWSLSDGYYNVDSCSGDMIDGIVLDDSNPEGGTPLTDWDVYDTAEYDTALYAPAAHYTSSRCHKSGGFSGITWYASGDPGDIMFQYRESADGTAWGSWSALTDAIGYGGQALSAEYMQFRFIFYSSLWSDADYFYVRTLT